MEILIIAATKFEISPLLHFLETEGKKEIDEQKYKYNNISINICVTGIGAVGTVYHLTRFLSVGKCDLVMNIGICGSFHPHIKIGQVVNVIEDLFGDLGIEDNNFFYTLFEKKLIEESEFPFCEGRLVNQNTSFDFLVEDLLKVNAITVNMSHGSKQSIDRMCQKFAPDIETMEGAGIFYVCKMEKTPCLQIRSISNYVEPRNTANWNIVLAVKRLNEKLILMLKQLA